MPQDFLTRTLRGPAPLWRALLRFNGLLPGVAVPWPKVGPPEVLCAFAGTGTASLWDKEPVRRCWPWEGKTPYFWDFSEESRRLALLDEADTRRLALLFGAAVHAQALSAVLARDEVARLREDLSADGGEDVLHYALTRGRFQAVQSARYLAGRDPAWPLSFRVRVHGRMALDAISRSWPANLRQRFGVLEEDEHGTLSRQWRLGLWQDMKKILLREVVPAWTPCFD